jgi:hypothetical protein
MVLIFLVLVFTFASTCLVLLVDGFPSLFYMYIQVFSKPLTRWARLQMRELDRGGVQ